MRVNAALMAPDIGRRLQEHVSGGGGAQKCRQEMLALLQTSPRVTSARLVLKQQEVARSLQKAQLNNVSWLVLCM